MVRLFDVLKALLDRMKEDNPFGLVLKGGTALAVHHLPGHRESEDLDFDAPIELRQRNAEIVKYFKERLEGLRRDGVLTGYEIPKAVFASTDRFHMTVLLAAHVRFQTKMDLTYRPMPDELETDGQLRFYTSERMLVDKLLTFASRGGLKDLYDLSMLLEKVKAGSYREPAKLAGLVDRTIERCNASGMVADYGRELRHADLRFRYLKESGVEAFVARTARNLRRFRNELMKKG
jgi:predicted nucleotidyltransferase component of viral defense system